MSGQAFGDEALNIKVTVRAFTLPDIFTVSFSLGGYLVTAVAVAGYLMFLLDWQARFARKWVLPLSAILLVVLIPIAWAAFVKARRKEKKEPVWPQVVLVPVWLYSLYVSLLIIGWMSIGGI